MSLHQGTAQSDVRQHVFVVARTETLQVLGADKVSPVRHVRGYASVRVGAHQTGAFTLHVEQAIDDGLNQFIRTASVASVLDASGFHAADVYVPVTRDLVRIRVSPAAADLKIVGYALPKG